MRHLRTSTPFALTGLLLCFSILPACGKKTVRSEQIEPTPEISASPSETDTPVPLVTETPTPEVITLLEPTTTPTLSDYTYVPDTVTMEQDPDAVETKLKKKPHASKPSKMAKTPPTPIPTDTPSPAATEVPTAVPTAPPVIALKTEPNDVEPSLKESSVSSFWWILLALLAIGGGWYYWVKRREAQSMSMPTRPAPPLGGLSPVSGYFSKTKSKTPRAGMKNRRKR